MKEGGFRSIWAVVKGSSNKGRKDKEEQGKVEAEGMEEDADEEEH